MKHLKNFIKILGLSCVLVFLSEKNAHAYLDPGSFSYVIQVIIAVAVGAAYALRTYWEKIKALFSKNKKGGTADENK